MLVTFMFSCADEAAGALDVSARRSTDKDQLTAVASRDAGRLKVPIVMRGAAQSRREVRPPAVRAARDETQRQRAVGCREDGGQ